MLSLLRVLQERDNRSEKILMNALDIINLKKTYIQNADKKVEALKGINFEIRPGEIFGLLGPNGAGKTTLINSITTLETPTSGDVRVFGTSVLESPLITKKSIGIVHQEIINTGFFDVLEILDFQSGYYGLINNDERIQYLVKKLSLDTHSTKKIKQLSGGMKRRLMIAKALVHSPRLLLLDEPTAGVDVELRESLWSFVRELKNEGISVLLTTHYLEEAEALCDRIGIINKGELIFCGTPKEVIAKYSTKKVSLKTKDGRSLNLIDSATKELAAILQENQIAFADIVDIQITEGKLEEAFTKVVNL
jgi:ABC-2 type transport system ATP-binding protein